MEDTNINSCLMWAVGLYTPVGLSSVFDSADLKDTGIELDSHITLLYAHGVVIPREDIMSDIETILGNEDFKEFMGIISDKDRNKGIRVLDLFDLGTFENDSDYVVLKLKKDWEWSRHLELINKGLRRKYSVSSEFTYTPHMTLAELEPGTAKKYVDSEKLKIILDHSLVSFEDILISYGSDNEVKDRKQYYLTQYSNVDRYFRLKNLEKEDKSIEED